MPWSFPDLSMLPYRNAQSSLLTKAVSLHGALVQQAKAQDRVLGGKRFKHRGRDETWWPAAHPYLKDARVDDQSRCRWQLKKSERSCQLQGLLEEPLRLCGEAAPQASCSANRTPTIINPTGKQDASRLIRCYASCTEGGRFCQSCSFPGAFRASSLSLGIWIELVAIYLEGDADQTNPRCFLTCLDGGSTCLEILPTPKARE